MDSKRKEIDEPNHGIHNLTPVGVNLSNGGRIEISVSHQQPSYRFIEIIDPAKDGESSKLQFVLNAEATMALAVCMNEANAIQHKIIKEKSLKSNLQK